MPTGSFTRSKIDASSFPGLFTRVEMGHIISLQDLKFGTVLTREESTRSWLNASDGFGVAAARQTTHGDVTLTLVNEY